MNLIISMVLFAVTQVYAQADSQSNSSNQLLFISMLVFFSVWFLLSGAQTKQPVNSLMKDTEEKFKNGEISKEEYDRRKQDFG